MPLLPSECKGQYQKVGSRPLTSADAWRDCYLKLNQLELDLGDNHGPHEGRRAKPRSGRQP
jgi:hypothetical protein